MDKERIVIDKKLNIYKREVFAENLISLNLHKLQSLINNQLVWKPSCKYILYFDVGKDLNNSVITDSGT